MKTKLLFLLIMLTCIATCLKAQSFKKSSGVFSTGIAVNTQSLHKDAGSGSPLLGLQYEMGLLNLKTAGTISTRVEAGFSKNSTSKWNCYSIGAGGAYHFPINTHNVDIYCGTLLLCKLQGYGNTANAAVYTGGRYLIANKVGFFTELNSAEPHLSIGTAVKFL